MSMGKGSEREVFSLSLSKGEGRLPSVLSAVALLAEVEALLAEVEAHLAEEGAEESLFLPVHGEGRCERGQV